MQLCSHFAVDLKSYDVDVGIITKLNFKTKHSDSVIGVNGYTVFQRDRVGHRGGGIALYVWST